ncbi:ImmA/IrrE family metallo-endopeptidase [Candidatus Roizmanbacteria bacterium]|nr:ImmA/IrrE family metallo-endopeptidase [Candidatus Roizmanbacteria bacterium]
MKLNLPRLTYQQIGNIADQFLTLNYPQLKLPIPIEQIAESKLNLKIYEEFNLKKDFDVESFLTSDLSTIFIDFDIYNKFENRARCSIAHEIGHLILHGKILSKLQISSTVKLGDFLNNVDEDEYGWLEYQAYSFANQVLVPKKLLFSEIKRLVGNIPNQASLESILLLLEDLSEVFHVSTGLMLRRLQKEEIVKSNS